MKSDFNSITQEIIDRELAIIEAFQNANPHFKKAPPYNNDFQNSYISAYYQFRKDFIENNPPSAQVFK